MNASVGDVLNQGRFAIYVSNISEEGILLQGNNLWVPTGERDGGCRSYENLARAMGVELGGWSFGAQFGDLNNDGFLDLYLVNGYVSASQQRELLVRLLEDRRRQPDRHLRRAELAGDGHAQPGRLPAEEGVDQRRRGPLRRRRADGRRHRSLRRPLGRARRSRRTAACSTSSSPTSAGRCCCIATRWRRAATGSPSSSKAAAGPDGAAGACTNRSAIGAQVTVFWNGQQQVQEVSGGSGFCAQNQRRLHFGLGRRRDGREGRRALAVRQDAGADAPGGQPGAQGRGAGMTTEQSPASSRRRRRARRGCSSTSATWRRSSSRASCSPASSPSASSRAGRGRSWRSRPRSSSSWSRAARSTASGRTWPAPTSRASASASWSARRRSGPTRCARRSRSRRSTCCASTGGHIWNPSNFGIVAMLVLAPDTVAGLSVQWGNNLLPMVVVWMLRLGDPADRSAACTSR